MVLGRVSSIIITFNNVAILLWSFLSKISVICSISVEHVLTCNCQLSSGFQFGEKNSRAFIISWQSQIEIIEDVWCRTYGPHEEQYIHSRPDRKHLSKLGGFLYGRSQLSKHNLTPDKHSLLYSTSFPSPTLTSTLPYTRTSLLHFLILALHFYTSSHSHFTSRLPPTLIFFTSPFCYFDTSSYDHFQFISPHMYIV